MARIEASRDRSGAPSDAAAHPMFVSAEVAERVLGWREMVAALARTYAAPQPEGASPPRTVARGATGNWLRTLTAVPPGTRYMGAKVFGIGRKKTLEYVVVLIDQETGRVAGFVDGNAITGLRTAATSALAVDRMAAPGACTLGVLGAGLEAHTHVRAIAAHRPVAALQVFSPTPARREAFAAEFAAELGVPCKAVASAEAAVAGACIVVAAARSRDESPILYGDWLVPGTLVVSIGSTLPEQREIDSSVVEACDLIVCDTVEEVTEETGDMIAATASGVAFAHKMVPLADLVAGKVDHRVAAARLPMFKSVGSAIQDIVVAELALDTARAQGLATELPVSFLTKGSGLRPRP